MVLDFVAHPERSGIFNLGTGRAQTFNDMARATINTVRVHRGMPEITLEQMHGDGLIDYIAFPDSLKGKYQHYTQADLTRLRASGYTAPFLTVDEGVSRYIRALIERGPR